MLCEEQDAAWDRAAMLAYFSGSVKDAKRPDDCNPTLQRSQQERIDDEKWLAEQVEPGAVDDGDDWIARAVEAHKNGQQK